MSQRKWNVWSIDTEKSRALVVDEGIRPYAIESAERRNAAAERLQVTNLRFLALPDGEVPHDE